MKLDIKDRKILAELFLDGHMSISKLAKKVGVSREVATYRINKLEKDVIRQYFSIINFEALGFKRYIMFIQLKGITPEKEQDYIEFLKNHDFVTYLGPVIGRWNIVLDILIKNDEHLAKVVNELTKKIHPYLEAYALNGSGNEEDFFPTKFVGIKKRMFAKRKIKKYACDEIDLNILSILAKNGRTDFIEISRKLKLASNTVRYRVKNMEKAGLILGYTISINFRKLDIEIYNIQVKLSGDISKNLIHYIEEHDRLLFYYKYIGNENYDIDIGIIVKNSEEFRSILIDLKKNFGEHFKIHDIYLLLGVEKDNICPEGVFLKT